MTMCKKKIPHIFSSLFLKEKYAWTFFCVCCTGFLLFKILMDFFVTKQTVTSVEEVDISEIEFPDVLVCLEDGFDKNALKGYGYGGSYQYLLGRNHSNNFIGWNGLQNNNLFRRDSSKVRRHGSYQRSEVFLGCL